MPSKPWHHAGSRHARGYGADWVRIRKIIISRDGEMCQPCLRMGRPTPFAEVDHIKPKAQGGTKDQDNLECVCGPCHDAKTRAEAMAALGHKAKPRPAFDAHGNVIWQE